jgi:release factor glutamine methyltransferase
MPEPYAPAQNLTIRAAIAHFTRQLTSAGVPDAAGDVRRLLAETLALSPAALLASPERALKHDEHARVARNMARRANREPVARILGIREFYGRPFAISPAVLDPRPDTETLITAALEIVAEEGWQQAPLRILDVGTGSGCLLVTLLCELPHATGIGTDISTAALEIARANAARHGVAGRAQFVEADALVIQSAPVHLLVTNPPYVRTSEVANLDPEVRAHDPMLALDGGADGLDIYRRLAPRIGAAAPDGWFICEVGYDQAPEVADLLGAELGREQAPQIRIYPDLAGRNRCVAVRTRG